MSEVRVLTVRQPWAWAIIYGGKDVENRVRNIAGDYRGPVAIHAAQKGSEDEASVAVWMKWLDTIDPDVRGAIIGVVDLVDVHLADDCLAQLGVYQGHEDDPDMDCCSEWADYSHDRDVHHLVLANPRALDEPIPWKGALGLRRTSFDIAGQWLVEQTDRCNCGNGASLAALYGHQPGCGFEPVALLLEAGAGS